MTENASFNEQEQHILIKNSVKDGIFINNKNKVDFTIANNQLSDNNINSHNI